MKNYQLSVTMAIAAGSLAAITQTTDWVKWTLIGVFSLAIYAVGQTLFNMFEESKKQTSENQQALVSELNNWQNVLSHQSQQSQTELFALMNGHQAEWFLKMDEFFTTNRQQHLEQEKRFSRIQEDWQHAHTEQGKRDEQRQVLITESMERLSTALHTQFEQLEQMHTSMQHQLETQRTHTESQSEFGTKLSRLVKNQNLLLQDIQEELNTVNEHVEESNEAFSSSQEQMEAMSNHFEDRMRLFHEGIVKLSEIVDELSESRAIERQEALQVQEGLIEKLKRYQKIDA